MKKKELKSTWEVFRDYINSKKIGDVISRQELISLFDNPTSYTDYLRNLSEKTGILEKYSKNNKIISGLFIVKKHFRKDLTVNLLREIYNDEIQSRIEYKDEFWYKQMTHENQLNFDMLLEQAKKEGLIREVLFIVRDQVKTGESPINALLCGLDEWDC